LVLPILVLPILRNRLVPPQVDTIQADLTGQFYPH
jgi:hypothetical protein